MNRYAISIDVHSRKFIIECNLQKIGEVDFPNPSGTPIEDNNGIMFEQLVELCIKLNDLTN